VRRRRWPRRDWVWGGFGKNCCTATQFWFFHGNATFSCIFIRWIPYAYRGV